MSLAHIIRSLIGLMALGLLTGCVSLERGDEAAVRRVVEDFIAAVNAADTERFVAFFAEDATVFFPSNASAARRRGVQAIRQAVQPVFAQGPPNPAARSDDLVISLRDGVAVVSFDAENGAAHSRRTLVLENRAGRWQVVHLHASNVASSP